MMQKTIAIARRKNIALVAHDNNKEELVEWAKFNCRLLAEHSLYSTRATGQLLKNRLGLRVALLESGPLGGDQQIGSRISEGQIDFVIFFSDPLQSQPHDPDVKAFLRITVVWNVPLACNRTSADFIISSPLMSTGYERLIPDYSKNRPPLAIGTHSKPATERAVETLLASSKPAENRRNVTTIEPSVGSIDSHSACLNEWRRQNVVGIAMALVFSGLAPALLMTAIWSDPRVRAHGVFVHIGDRARPCCSVRLNNLFDLSITWMGRRHLICCDRFCHRSRACRLFYPFRFPTG